MNNICIIHFNLQISSNTIWIQNFFYKISSVFYLIFHSNKKKKKRRNYNVISSALPYNFTIKKIIPGHVTTSSYKSCIIEKTVTASFEYISRALEFAINTMLGRISREWVFFPCTHSPVDISSVAVKCSGNKVVNTVLAGRKYYACSVLGTEAPPRG